VPAALPAGGCTLVVTARPRDVLSRPAFAHAPVVAFARLSPEEVPLYAVDLCGGEMARRMEAPAAAR
jgi:hypothetical protein